MAVSHRRAAAGKRISGRRPPQNAGDPVEVRLGCRNDLAKYVVDRFGDKLETKPLSSESFEVTVEVALSPTFYGWLFGFAGGIRILGPSEVIAEYNEMLNSALTAQSL